MAGRKLNSATDLQPDLTDAWPFDEEGRYQILGLLGSGGFGDVYRAYDLRSGQQVALKTLRDPTPEDRQRLKEESRILKKVEERTGVDDVEYRTLHEITYRNPVRLHDLHIDGDKCYFTMDLIVDGAPFDQRLNFDRRAPLAVQESAIRRICAAAVQLADGLYAIHRAGHRHGDVKPSNVLVTPDDCVVVLDFGLSRPVAALSALISQNSISGTFHYLAPEQYDLQTRARPAADWYSAGVMLYETLTGTTLFSGSVLEVGLAKRQLPAPPSIHVAAIPPALDALVMAMLSPQPGERPDGETVCLRLRELTGPTVRDGTAYLNSNLGRAPFVSRVDELAVLARAYRESVQSRLVVVDIVGSSGIGKSALVRHFLEELTTAPTPPLVFESRCHPHESIPYKAFDAVIDDLSRYWSGLSEAQGRALLADEGLTALVKLFADLSRVPLLAPYAHARLRHGDPRSLRDSGFRALREVLTRLSFDRPVVIWVDDVQWADADSAALIEGVFGGDSAPALLLVLTRRPDHETAQPALLEALAEIGRSGQISHIELAPLAPESASELASQIIARRGAVSQELIDAVVEQGNGVPYLVSELAHFAARRHVGDEPSHFTTGSTALIHERLDALPSEDRHLLELAALAGGPLQPNVLLEAAESRQSRRLHDLCMLRLFRWTTVAGDQCLQIYHDHLGEVVVRNMGVEARRQAHHALLLAMERTLDAQSFERDADDYAEQMLGHAIAAGERARAYYHAVRAAKRAAAALAFEQAARQYRVALDFADARSDDDVPLFELHASLAEALANSGRSTEAAPQFETACAALSIERNADMTRVSLFRRRAGEQYLKAGQFNEGLRLMSAFLAEAGVILPRSGRVALMTSTWRRLRLYMRGFHTRPPPAAGPDARVRSRLDDLWAATTSLSMMDPVRSDSVGLLHFYEALNASDERHVACSLGYEAAFAALIGGKWLRAKARQLLDFNRALLNDNMGAYEHAFYHLGLGVSAFFHSDWEVAVTHCDLAAERFRNECPGASYEAAVALVFSLQALGQAGAVRHLVHRIPEAIREADVRGDLFAANNYRGGFHALGRVAAGQLDEVRADLQKVVETWTSGFYQMHAYHRVFAGVAADLYTGNPHAALARIDHDWPELKAGLFLHMELPAMELRWTRARACLAVAGASDGPYRKALLARVTTLTRQVARATVAAARPHAALLRAGVAATGADTVGAMREVKVALDGYSAAGMAIHREVARWCLAHLHEGAHGRALAEETRAWMLSEGVPAMQPLVATIAPGLEAFVTDEWPRSVP